MLLTALLSSVVSSFVYARSFLPPYSRTRYTYFTEGESGIPTATLSGGRVPSSGTRLGVTNRVTRLFRRHTAGQRHEARGDESELMNQESVD